MAITADQLRSRLAAGQALLGTFVATPSAEVVEMLGLAGFDFCVLDMEHAHFGTETVAHLLRAAELRDMAALVRIPSSSPEQVGVVLDLGAAGVMVPSIASADEAARMLALTRYPPIGTRGAHLSTRHLRYSALPFSTAADDSMRPFTVLQIESALNETRIREVVNTPGLDVVFIGINDLAQSLGRPGNFEHPDVQKVVHGIVRAANSRGVALGLWAREPSAIGPLRQRGFSFLTVSNNELMFYEAAKSLVQQSQHSLASSAKPTKDHP